jgi:hypothetical protein
VSANNDNFEKALAEWRRKHGIRDDDSVLQMLELLKLFFQNVKIEIPPDTDSIQLVTIRVSLQTLAQLTKDFSRTARELTEEIRIAPKINEQSAGGRSIVLLFAMIIALVAGIMIGKFLL